MKSNKENLLKKSKPNNKNLTLISKPKEKTGKDKIKNKILFLSQMFWFFYIFIFILLGFIFPRYHPSQTFISQNETKKFDKYEEPLIYTHVSDIHFSNIMPKRTKEMRKIFQIIK